MQNHRNLWEFFLGEDVFSVGNFNLHNSLQVAPSF